MSLCSTDLPAPSETEATMSDYEMEWVSALSPALLQGQSIWGAIQSKMSQRSSIQAPRYLFEIFNHQNTLYPHCL